MLLWPQLKRFVPSRFLNQKDHSSAVEGAASAAEGASSAVEVASSAVEVVATDTELPVISNSNSGGKAA